jgi:hypothetical protein
MDQVEANRPPKCVPEIDQLANGLPIDEEGILRLCRFVDTREDCADFRLTSLIRILYQFSHLLSTETLGIMKSTILNFRYWMDEPGNDSMCFWSENHQLLFGSCEFLAGQYFQNEVFTNNGMTGRERQEHSRSRLIQWLQDRWTYGFIEWHSNVYYEEDLAPLSNLIDFAADRDLHELSVMIMDLFLIDMGLHSWKGFFNASSGRCYERQKQNPRRADTIQITQELWGDPATVEHDSASLTGVFRQMKNYRIPEIIKTIGLNPGPMVIKTSNGLNLSELKVKGFDMKSHRTSAFLWAMEAFSNPEAIQLTMDTFVDWNMKNNRFLKDLKPFSHPLLRKTGLLPLMTRVLNPVTNGVAIQRANTYTFKTPDYMLSTAWAYHPGDYGDQQHIWTALVSPEINVFTTHPAVLYFSGEELLSLSPNAWVGNGRNPHSVQHENISLSLYMLPRRKGFLEKKLHHFTHAWFPQEKFDQVVLKKDRIVGRSGDTYIALIGGGLLKFSTADPNELIQNGRNTWWACIMGSRNQHGGFGDFLDMIMGVTGSLRGRRIILNTPSATLDLTFKGPFMVNGEKVSGDFPRLESPFGKIVRDPETMVLEAGGHRLTLNFGNRIRIEEEIS